MPRLVSKRKTPAYTTVSPETRIPTFFFLWIEPSCQYSFLHLVFLATPFPHPSILPQIPTTIDDLDNTDNECAGPPHLGRRFFCAGFFWSFQTFPHESCRVRTTQKEKKKNCYFCFKVVPYALMYLLCLWSMNTSPNFFFFPLFPPHLLDLPFTFHLLVDFMTPFAVLYGCHVTFFILYIGTSFLYCKGTKTALWLVDEEDVG